MFSFDLERNVPHLVSCWTIVLLPVCCDDNQPVSMEGHFTEASSYGQLASFLLMFRFYYVDVGMSMKTWLLTMLSFSFMMCIVYLYLYNDCPSSQVGYSSEDIPSLCEWDSDDVVVGIQTPGIFYSRVSSVLVCCSEVFTQISTWIVINFSRVAWEVTEDWSRVLCRFRFSNLLWLYRCGSIILLSYRYFSKNQVRHVNRTFWIFEIG